jgi:3-polyprenyl-4-hydroxybenzoate decarboxylase
MPFRDLRELILKLEDLGELVRVKTEVDWSKELAAVARPKTEQTPDMPRFRLFPYCYPNGDAEKFNSQRTC